MYELTIKSVEGGSATDAGSVQVDPEALGGKVRSRLLHQACVMYAANKRLGTAKTKTRGEIHKANRKPWRQKGTGRARAGTRRSPLWRGGGTTFGPRPRDYSYSIGKKARRRAAQSALHSKLRDGETIVVKAMPDTGRTRDVAATLKALEVTGKVLLVTAEEQPMLARATRNMRDVGLMPVRQLNAYDLLYHKRLVITEEALAKALELFRMPEGRRGAGAAVSAEKAEKEA